MRKQPQSQSQAPAQCAAASNSARCSPPHQRRRRGFTLMELMVVMAIIASLLTLALPRYFHSVSRSREAVLRHDLHAMRDAIDKFLADRGRYPATLDELADLRYLRKVPPDPITDSAATWITVPPPDNTPGDGSAPAAGVYDVRSGAPGKSLDGEAYESW
jgi:general secretion pathway protein G